MTKGRKRGLLIGAVALLAFFEVTLLVGGFRVFLWQALVQPGQTYMVSGFGDVGKQGQASLVCRYFTGRTIATDVLWYSSTNQMGRDECPFLAIENAKDAAREADGGSLADWVSGIGTMLAVFVALGGYWFSEWQRRRDEKQRQQDAVYQIGFKLSSLASEAHNTLIDLNPREKPLDDLMAETDPMEICGMQEASVGYDAGMVKDLAENEQNLLMRIKEEGFLMDFSEAVTRNNTIRAGLQEYKIKREAIMSMLPVATVINGQIASHDIPQEDMMRIYPTLIQAASLIQKVRTMARINVNKMRELGTRYQPMMSGHFPKLHIHKIEFEAEADKVVQ